VKGNDVQKIPTRYGVKSKKLLWDEGGEYYIPTNAFSISKLPY